MIAGGLVAAAIGIAARTSSDALSLPTAVDAVTLQEAAVRQASAAGERNPYGGILVATTERRFFDTRGGGGPLSDRDVYVVGLRGQFTAYGASRPAGAPHPTGTFFYMMFDTGTLEALGGGIGAPTSLAGLGPSLRFGPETAEEAHASD